MVSGQRNGDGSSLEDTASKVISADGGDNNPRTPILIEEIFGVEFEIAPTSGECCNMCGDVGFADQLLHCSYCLERLEHKYCSTSYRELGSNEASWVCDWCWPALKTESSESDWQESIKSESQESSGKYGTWGGRSPRAQNGLDLLLEVAGAAIGGLRERLPTPEKDSVQVTAKASSASPKVESNPTQASCGTKRRQGLGQDRWSVTQKRGCSRNYETICARTGIQLDRVNLDRVSLDRVNLAKGLGRRYRLLSSMLC